MDHSVFYVGTSGWTYDDYLVAMKKLTQDRDHDGHRRREVDQGFNAQRPGSGIKIKNTFFCKTLIEAAEDVKDGFSCPI